VGFSIEEDPICVFEDLFPGIDDTGLDVSGGIEDFTSKVACGCNDHKSEIRNINKGRYLWKTETQLSGPDSHLLRYPSNVGWRESRKDPMTGILNRGPAIPLLFI
jgi:hypothetical protein